MQYTKGKRPVPNVASSDQKPKKSVTNKFLDSLETNKESPSEEGSSLGL